MKVKSAKIKALNIYEVFKDVQEFLGMLVAPRRARGGIVEDEVGKDFRFMFHEDRVCGFAVYGESFGEIWLDFMSRGGFHGDVWEERKEKEID